MPPTAAAPSLAKSHLAAFEQIVRQKGRQLFQAGRCHIAKNEPGMVRGACQDGEDKFAVGARLQGDEIHVHCECPYFQARTGCCRHLWAMLLTLDQRGLAPYLTLDEDAGDGDGSLVADEIWLERPALSRSGSEESKSWKSLISVVEKIRQSQEKLLFKPLISYVLDLGKDENGRTMMGLTVRIAAAEMAPEEGNPFFNVPMERLLPILKQVDAQIFALVLGNCASDPMGSERHFQLPISIEPKLSELLVQTHCTVSHNGVPQASLELDPGVEWEVILRIEDYGSHSLLRPLLVRGREELSLDKVAHFIAAYPRGFYTLSRRGRLKDNVDNVWLQALEHGEPAYTIPLSGIRDFLTHFSKACSGLHPRVEWPENFWTAVTLEKPPLPIFQMEFNELGVTAELLFEYQLDPSQRISAYSAQEQVLQWGTRKSCQRKLEAEQEVIAGLEKVPHLIYVAEDHLYHVDHENIQNALGALQALGITLYGKERKLKIFSKVHLELSTKIDWFEIKGRLEFGDQSVALGSMLDAIRNNSRYVLLGSGDYGLLPEQWIARNRHLLEAAEGKEEGLRIKKNQFLLLQQMLEAGETGVEVKKGKGTAELDQMVRTAEEFTGLREAKQPAGFKGEMRHYQLSGLAWLQFLKKFRFGGILADDMGLGKTIQAIASLLEESSGKNAAEGRCNLIVLPTSLVFNWTDEVHRFAPDLRVRSYTGTERGSLASCAQETDVLLTTYGILRRQAEEFARIHWNYIILDEAQAIKNHKSQIATAVCSLQGTHRLSLTGTPIENNLLELWSHMEFLNPALLGSREQFSAQLAARHEPTPGKEGGGGNLQKLQRLVFPFILRRTKEDVLTDLPEKIEQIVQCTMGSRQQEYYNAIRDEFRKSLLDNISTRGVESSKLKVIEGLLRLRQVACHPSLVDRNLSIPSTKLKHLMSSLEEAVAEGHKVLVFSQFTSMLELVVRELTRENLRFTYLDGQTRDRQERVRNFQNDASLQIFLISLKAGGTGLNLTAADYVFLYDPWWNPAAEQQAIDRAHRIGQTKNVFTYKLITKDTVEEKVVELQQTKMNMVKDIISSDEGEFVKNLSKMDIEYLFT